MNWKAGFQNKRKCNTHLKCAGTVFDERGQEWHWYQKHGDGTKYGIKKMEI